MKRIAVFTAVLLVLVTLIVPAAQAGPGTTLTIEFTLDGTMAPLPPLKWVPPPDPVKVLTHGITAEGNVTGYFEGTFEYKEKGVADPGLTEAEVKGDMTITTGKGKVMIRFTGTDVFTSSGIEVTGQPWTIKGGTGDYAGIKGGGTRSSVTPCAPGYGVCVKYTGDITLKK